MTNQNAELLGATSKVITEIQSLLSRKLAPIVITLDGASGAGKSTLASILASELDVAVIPLDDFFAGNIPDHRWDEFTVEEKLKYVFDWQRVRTQVLEPLRRNQPALWYAFDFQAGLHADRTYGMEEKPKERKPAQVILLEGAYSANPQLADLVDLTILIDVPIEERHARIAKREDSDFLAIWHQRWDEVETYYFTQVRPKNSFDVVVELK